MTRYIWVVLLLLVVVSPVEIAQACSGGPEQASFDYAIENADYIVKATVVHVDYVHVNAILVAEQYLTGENGPEIFLLNQFSPTSLALRNIYTDTQCGLGGYRFTLGESAYFAINRAIDGSYHFTPAPEGYGLQVMIAAQFPTAIYLHSDAETETGNMSVVSIEVGDEQAFIDLVEASSGQEADVPYRIGSEMVYPLVLTAPLLITTDQDTQYMLPVDFGELVPLETPTTPRSNWSPNAFPNLFAIPNFCATVDCLLFTPDLRLSGTRTADNSIHVNLPMVAEGQAFAFSSMGEVVVVWRDSFLDIYLVSLDTTFIYESFPALALLAQIPLATNETLPVSALYGMAMWSADGTTLTYGDANGVWLLDIFRQSEPQLIVAAENGRVPSPLFLSTNARYLAYTWDRTGTDWTTLDRITGETFENALISPNERYMALIASPNTVMTDSQEMGCELPLSYDCSEVVVETPRYFEWVEDEYYVSLQCDENEVCSFAGEQVNYLPTINRGNYYNFPVPNYAGWLGDIDYESHQRIFAMVSAPQSIIVYNTNNPLDLSAQLDGDIVDIEWLPSLFYYRE